MLLCSRGWVTLWCIIWYKNGKRYMYYAVEDANNPVMNIFILSQITASHGNQVKNGLDLDPPTFPAMGVHSN